jgi:hypothetical protein
MQGWEEIQNEVVERLKARNHIVRIFPNGHIKINRWNFWCSSEKYWNEITHVKGIGFKNFVDAVENEVI